MCSAAGASIGWAIDYNLTLRDVRVVDNAPTFGSAFAAAYIVNGTLTMEDTTIANNSVTGMEGDGSAIYCSGTKKNDAGVWGNSGYGMLLYSYSKTPLLFESDGCDFDGVAPLYKPSYDAVLYNSTSKSTQEWGDDVDFLCDISTVSCKK